MIEVKQIDIESIAYLVRSLENFEKDKAIKRGLLDAGNVLKSGGKQRLRERLKDKKGGKGNLLRSFQVRVKRNKPGVLAGFRRGKAGGNHAHLVDRGTKQRFTKSGESRGRMPANSFWSDTENQDSAKVIDRLFTGVERAVENINNRR